MNKNKDQLAKMIILFIRLIKDLKADFSTLNIELESQLGHRKKFQVRGRVSNSSVHPTFISEVQDSKNIHINSCLFDLTSVCVPEILTPWQTKRLKKWMAINKDGYRLPSTSLPSSYPLQAFRDICIVLQQKPPQSSLQFLLYKETAILAHI